MTALDRPRLCLCDELILACTLSAVDELPGLEGAIEQLAVCQGQPCGAATVTLWQEARDRLVYQRREAAGAAFISASKLPTKAERVKAYGSVQANLQALQTEYPDSRYKDGVAASLQTVANAIDAENQ